MTKVDLITGFLGVGKTTFLKRYIKYLLNKNERICVLEFDYGAVNVDTMLLQEFNDQIDIESVAGGCDYGCHLRRFKTKLIAMGMKKYDRVIIEPSGIFDVDEFFDVINEEPLNSWYQIGSIITLVDSNLNNLSNESKYILASQIAPAGVVMLTKTDINSEEVIKTSLEYLSEVLQLFKIDLSKKKIIDKNLNNFNDEDYELITSIRPNYQDFTKSHVISDNSYSSIYLLESKTTLDDINRIKDFIFNEEYGKVLRVKGFINDDNKWYQINITLNECLINPIENGQDVLIVIGEELAKDKINCLFINKLSE